MATPTFWRLPRLSVGDIAMRSGLAVCLCFVGAAALGQQTPTLNPCVAPEQKQLEFWAGDWQLMWPAAGQGRVDHGTSSIHRLLDSCVVQENFSGENAMHLRGMSVSIFDTGAHK